MNYTTYMSSLDLKKIYPYLNKNVQIVIYKLEAGNRLVESTKYPRDKSDYIDGKEYLKG